MRIDFAHLRERAQSGGDQLLCLRGEISVGSCTDNSRVLAQLRAKARANNLRVDQAALAFENAGRLQFFGSPHLVEFLSRRGLPGWTHQTEV